MPSYYRSVLQGEHFLQTLAAKAFPGKLQALMDILEQLGGVGPYGQPPCIFKGHLDLQSPWF